MTEPTQISFSGSSGCLQISELPPAVVGVGSNQIQFSFVIWLTNECANIKSMVRDLGASYWLLPGNYELIVMTIVQTVLGSCSVPYSRNNILIVTEDAPPTWATFLSCDYGWQIARGQVLGVGWWRFAHPPRAVTTVDRHWGRSGFSGWPVAM